MGGRYCHILSDCRSVGIGNCIIERLLISATSHYSAIANSHNLQFTTARTKLSQSALSSPVVAW
jgi:hypothetical protein